ncbi:MAG: hypothetical protein L3J96_05170, partial [Thermoplasmata archaeon]|nr:hypothetical protein [Thermoplasmata archaeon]
MSDPAIAAEALQATRAALARVRALRTRGVPFDPLKEIDSLREALAGEGSVLALVAAAELEVSCSRVELAWAELEARRESIERLVRSIGSGAERPPPSAGTADEFLRTWQDPFADVLTLEGRVWLARRLETRLGDDLGAKPMAPATLGQAVVDSPGDPSDLPHGDEVHIDPTS